MSSQEEEKQLKREDELAELSQIPKPLIEKAIEKVDKEETTKPAEPHGFFDKIKEGISDIATKISDQVEKLMNPETKTEKKGEEERETFMEKTKEEVEDLGKKISEAVGEYPASGDMSSKTTIQPNREGPSTLEKINEASGKVTEQISQKADEMKEKIEPKEPSQRNEGEEKSFTEKLQEGVIKIVRKISETFEEKTEQLFSSLESSGKKGTQESEKHPVRDKIKNVMSEISDDMTLTYGDEKSKKESELKTEGKSEEKAEENVSKNIELAPIKEVHPVEFKDFKTVKTGFSETVKELKEEQRIEDVGQKSLASNNPFEVLASKDLNIAQPLESAEVVGGELPVSEGPKTVTEDVANKFVRESEAREEIREKTGPALSAEDQENVTSV